MIDVKALPIVDAFTSNGQPLVAILGPNHEVYWEAVKKMEGILPLIFESRKGGPLKEYKIYGNAPHQEWTPSPEKERTANLFDNSDINASQVGVNIKTFGNYLVINGTKVDGTNVISVKTTDITLKPGTYTLSVELVSGTVTDSSEGVYFGINRNTYSQRTTPAINISGKKGVRTFTLTEDTKITSFDITCGYGDVGAVYTNAVFACMLNEGSTVLPYEPYGYREKTGPCEVKGVGEKTGNLFDEVKTDTTLMRFENGKAISSGRATICDYFLKAGTYTICIKSNISSVYLREGKVTSGFFSRLNIGNNTVTFTFDSDKYLRISAYSDNIGEVMYEDIMLNSDSTPLPYEPYGYKTTVVDEGKNLFDDTNHGNRLDTNGNFIEEANSFCTDYISAIAGQKYIVDCFVEHADTSGYAWILCCYDDNKKMVRRYTNLTRSFSFTIQMNEKYFIICKRCQSSAIINRVQLELGTTATPYTPYRPPIETTIYHDELYFTNDYIRKDKDGGVEYRRWGKYVCTGDENWLSNTTIHAGDTFYTDNQIPNYKKSSSTGYCSHLPLSKDYDNYTGIFFGVNINLIFDKALGIKYSSDCKAFLKSEYDAGHPVTIYYQLATPTDTEKDLPDIVTASGYNSIDTDTQIKPEKMEIAYR